MVRNQIRLLVLDDQIIDREITKLACGMIYVHCDSTGDIDYFIENFEKYDGAILDYSMPEKNGAEIAEIMRKKDPAYPLIFRSNWPEGSRQYHAMQSFGPIIKKDTQAKTLEILQDFVSKIYDGRMKKVLDQHVQEHERRQFARRKTDTQPQ